MSDLSFVWRHKTEALTNYRWVIIRCHRDSAKGLSSKGLASAHRSIEQAATTSYCARASENSFFRREYSIFKSSQFFVEERDLEQHPICNQSVRLCRKALRKSSCSLVLYLLWVLTEIIFLNGIKGRERENWSRGNAQLNLIDCSAVCSNLPYQNCTQPHCFCLQSEQADKLGPHLKKIFKHFVWVRNCLNAKFP